MCRAAFEIRYVTCVLSFLFLVFSGFCADAQGNVWMDENVMAGIPFGGDEEEADLDLCPYGARVIAMFLGAWQKEDYGTMYNLLDNKSKEDYSFEQARLDFQSLEFKPYTISSVRKSGEDFEFILSHGDWKSGDKDTKKMIISGKTFKIIMPTKNSPFKKSLESYL
jgi:hypothetical protein